MKGKNIHNLFNLCCGAVTMSLWNWAASVSLNLLIPPDTCLNMEQQFNYINRGNGRTWRESRPSATLSTINPTWTRLCANLGLLGEKPATNRPTYGMPPWALTLAVFRQSVLQFTSWLHDLCVIWDAVHIHPYYNGCLKKSVDLYSVRWLCYEPTVTSIL
jgi:hypothetical protein